jgi:ABC-type molybdate transport system ATPase subunit
MNNIRLTWRALNNQLSMMSEDEVLSLLDLEKQGEKRASVLQRLHQRANVLRVSRERLEILKLAVRP